MPYIDELIQTLAAFCGTLSFGFLFHIRGKKLLFAALGGMLAWMLFLVLGTVWEGEVLRYFLVSVVMSLYAEVLARVMKTPATTFCIVSLVPLIPGGGLYYSMTYGLSGAYGDFAEKALYTLELAVALSLGIVLVTACMNQIGLSARRKHIIK